MSHKGAEMRVTFWGTRGSIAKAGPSTVRFGGNTSCVEVQSDSGTLIVIDCGTGAHGLGADLVARSNGAPVNGHLLISHTHWDHIQGLPFFAPLFQPGNEWHIYGPRGLGASVLETLAGQMQYSYFPISLEQLAATVQYHDLVDGVFEIDDVSITTQYLNHPALTLGYRLEADGASVVYASDHEPHQPELAFGGDLMASRNDAAHVRFLKDADLIIHDAQYLAEEYGTKAGWGHSPVEYCVAAAAQAGAGKLALFHHDPARTDDAVDVIVALAQAQAVAADYRGEVFAAAEGMELVLAGTKTSSDSKPDRSGAATRKPALEEVKRSILISVQNPEIRAVVRQAADAAQLIVWEEQDAGKALEVASSREPAIIVLEDNPGVLEQARGLRALKSSYGANVSIFTVTESGARQRIDRQSISEWLQWPFGAAYARTKFHASLLGRACRWENAPLPIHEERRLRALRNLGILDTQPEARFDRYTDEASYLLDMPVALVSLVDAHRQWFKSAHGTDLIETPRDIAFCAHAILDDHVLQVPDALNDRRFAENPAVAGDPRIRFYAGVPLALSDGSPVGTLCVIDFRPRLLSESQIADLRHLADLVVAELETADPIIC